MTKPHVFNGGWLDLPGLLRDLGGQPLQADVEEVFTPGTGGEVRRRSGRLWVDRRRRVRMDVQEEGSPAVMFCFDAVTQTVVCGVADQPDSWVRRRWPLPVADPPASPTTPPRSLGIRVEFKDAQGSHVYQLFNERYDDPEKGVFPPEPADQ